MTALLFDTLVDECVDLELGADVDAARRSVEDEDVCVRVEPLGQNDLSSAAARPTKSRVLETELERGCSSAMAATASSLRPVDEALGA